MYDRVHQPYRAAMCPMLPRLLPLAGREGILGVALSGAGPAVLMIVESEASLGAVRAAIVTALEGLPEAELMTHRLR